MKAILTVGLSVFAVCCYNTFAAPISDSRQLWPNGRVPYEISNPSNKALKDATLKAIQIIQDASCVRFVPRTNEADYVKIVDENYNHEHPRDGSCYSWVGKKGGLQTVLLGGWCATCNEFRDSRASCPALHELMHAIGFDHDTDAELAESKRVGRIDNVMGGGSNYLNSHDTQRIRTLYKCGGGGGNSRCNGSRCGCYKNYCWAHVDENQHVPGWWCYTQREGVLGKHQDWATCNNDADCSWEMTCGSCNWHRGDEGNEMRTDCTTTNK